MSNKLWRVWLEDETFEVSFVVLAESGEEAIERMKLVKYVPLKNPRWSSEEILTGYAVES